MFDARYASILLFPEWGGKLVYQTSVENGEVVARMQPAVFDYLADPWNGMVRSTDGVIVRRPDGEPLGFPGVGRIKDAMVAPIRTESRIVGIMLVGGPVSEMTVFDETDLRSFATIARQLAVSLERGRLEDSLHEVTELKEQLDYIVKEVKPGIEKGWRRVVPSPEPIDIVEKVSIQDLVKGGVIVVASRVFG